MKILKRKPTIARIVSGRAWLLWNDRKQMYQVYKKPPGKARGHLIGESVNFDAAMRVLERVG